MTNSEKIQILLEKSAVIEETLKMLLVNDVLKDAENLMGQGKSPAPQDESKKIEELCELLEEKESKINDLKNQIETQKRRIKTLQELSDSKDRTIYIKDERIKVLQKSIDLYPYNQLFSEIKKMSKKFVISGINFLAVQITVTDENAGIFYIEVKNGKVSVEPYDYKDRDCEIVISIEELKKLIDKKVDPVSAFRNGEFKINGNTAKALELAKIANLTSSFSGNSSGKILVGGTVKIETSCKRCYASYAGAAMSIKSYTAGAYSKVFRVEDYKNSRYKLSFNNAYGHCKQFWVEEEYVKPV